MSKAHPLRCAAYNIGPLLCKVWGYHEARNGEAATAALFFALSVLPATEAIMVWYIFKPMPGWSLGAQDMPL